FRSFPDWHFTRYVATMRTLLDLDWDLFVPGHFWPVDRAGFEENLAFFDVLAEAAREAVAAGVDPDSYEEATAFAKERLGPTHGRLFRFDEYIGTNLMRVMLHELTGGWGLEDNK